MEQITATSASMMLVASSRPPKPTSSTATSTTARLKQVERRQRVVFEKRERDVAANRVDALERFDEARIAGLHPVDADALVVTREVRRGEAPQRRPAARSSASRQATVDPLPLVPPTVITRKSGVSRSRRRATSRTRLR